MKNCLTYYPYRWRHYVKKPWEFFEDTWLNMKAAWQRATRGWADRDVWNLCHHLLDIMPEMVDHLSNHAHGYPGEYNGFPTYESWIKFLREEIAAPLRCANEEQKFQINEYEEELLSYPMNFVKEKNGFTSIQFTEPDELRKKWCEREREINEWRQKELERALGNMAKNWFSLWD